MNRIHDGARIATQNAFGVVTNCYSVAGSYRGASPGGAMVRGGARMPVYVEWHGTCMDGSPCVARNANKSRKGLAWYGGVCMMMTQTRSAMP